LLNSLQTNVDHSSSNNFVFPPCQLWAMHDNLPQIHTHLVQIFFFLRFEANIQLRWVKECLPRTWLMMSMQVVLCNSNCRTEMSYCSIAVISALRNFFLQIFSWMVVSLKG
jgi:hypothetical protein